MIKLNPYFGWSLGVVSLLNELFKLWPSLVRGGCYSYVIIMLALLYSLAHTEPHASWRDRILLEVLCDLPSSGAQQVAWYGYCGFASCASS